MTVYYRGVDNGEYVYSQDTPPVGATDVIVIYQTSSGGGGATDRGTFDSIFDLPNALSSANTVSALAIGDYATVTSESATPFYCTYEAEGFASWSQDIGVPTDFGDNLAAWWEADRGVTLSGDDVVSWTDQSLNGYVLTSSAADRPTYTTSSSGLARAAIVFDGSTSRLSGGDILNPDDTSMTWFIVVSCSDAGGTHAIGGKRNGGGGGGSDAGYLFSSFSEQGNYRQFFIDTGTGGWAASAITDNFFGDYLFHVITAQTDRSLGTWRNFTDGNLSGEGTTAGVIDYNITSTGDFVIGCAPYVAAPTEYYDGEIAAIIFYRELLTGSQRGRVEAYLRNKYNNDVGY